MATAPFGVLACISALESGFYSSVKVEKSSWKAVEWIRAKSVLYYSKIQIVCNVANGVLSAVYFAVFDMALYQNHAFSFIRFSASHPLITCVAAIGIALIFAKYQPAPPPPERRGEVEIVKEPSFRQKLARLLHVVHLVSIAAVTYFAGIQFWLVFAALNSLYCLYKSGKISWINFTRVFPQRGVSLERAPGQRLPPALVENVKFTYHMLALEPSEIGHEDCPICLEPGPNTAFCENHLFHSDCLAGMVAEKSNEFPRQVRLNINDTNHYKNGFHTHTTRSFSVSIPKSNLPTCPLCRSAPPNNGFDVEILDRNYSPLHQSASVSMA